jgi:hypothetical protein
VRSSSILGGRRARTVLAWTANAVLLPVTLLGALVLANSVNPMQLVFMNEIEVENAGAEPIRVTVVGRDERGGPWIPASYLASFPALPGGSLRDLDVPAGARRTFVFDGDDVTPEGVLWERRGTPTYARFETSRGWSIVVDDSLAAETPPEAVVRQVERQRSPALVAVLPAVFPFAAAFHVWSLRRRRPRPRSIPA